MNTEMEPRTTGTGRLARLAVGAAGLWVLAGAGFKLFLGTPADLPALVRDVPLELGLTYRLAITIELCVGFLALLRPRWAWLPLVGMYLVFDAILLTMLGEESCGCFGSQVTIAPVTMLVIDTALLIGCLATRPWSRLRPGPPGLAMIAAALAAGIVLPWIFDRQAQPGGDGSLEVDGRPVEGQWLELDVESWVGRTLAETPLAAHLDLDAMIQDGLWVLYRSTCDHCAEHLAKLAQSEVGERFITLVRLREPTDNEANRVVHLVPEGGFVQNAELPDSLTYILTTPADLFVENGVIVDAHEGAGDHEEH
jgi:hypothetical protein